jgi:hypothetical protein
MASQPLPSSEGVLLDPDKDKLSASNQDVLMSEVGSFGAQEAVTSSAALVASLVDDLRHLVPPTAGYLTYRVTLSKTGQMPSIGSICEALTQQGLKVHPLSRRAGPRQASILIEGAPRAPRQFKIGETMVYLSLKATLYRLRVSGLYDVNEAKIRSAFSQWGKIIEFKKDNANRAYEFMFSELNDHEVRETSNITLNDACSLRLDWWKRPSKGKEKKYVTKAQLEASNKRRLAAVKVPQTAAAPNELRAQAQGPKAVETKDSARANTQEKDRASEEPASASKSVSHGSRKGPQNPNKDKTMKILVPGEGSSSDCSHDNNKEVAKLQRQLAIEQHARASASERAEASEGRLQQVISLVFPTSPEIEAHPTRVRRRSLCYTPLFSSAAPSRLLYSGTPGLPVDISPTDDRLMQPQTGKRSDFSDIWSDSPESNPPTKTSKNSEDAQDDDTPSQTQATATASRSLRPKDSTEETDSVGALAGPTVQEAPNPSTFLSPYPTKSSKNPRGTLPVGKAKSCLASPSDETSSGMASPQSPMEVNSEGDSSDSSQ